MTEVEEPDEEEEEEECMIIFRVALTTSCHRKQYQQLGLSNVHEACSLWGRI